MVLEFAETTALFGHAIQIVIAVAAVAGLMLSVWAQIRLSSLQGMQFPGVTAHLISKHEAGANDYGPPLNHDTYEFRLNLTHSNDDFSISEVRLTRWDAYWAEHTLKVRHHNGTQVSVFIGILMSRNGVLPNFLRARVERKGGAQTACWQKVRIEMPPSE